MWRVIIDEKDGFLSMAYDEIILEANLRGIAPKTLRLYVINPSAVTIGYFQKIHDIVNLDFTNKNRIPVIRRITGGGAVYHDSQGEITYSVVAPISEIASDVQESYKIICMGIVNALKKFNLNAVFKPINDVIVNGKKISGSAQIRRKNYLLQHGTLMYNTNLEILSQTLKPLKEKLASHGIASIKQRVTTISLELGRKVSKDEVINKMLEGFKEALDDDFEMGTYTDWEREHVYEIVKKYKNPEWTFKR